MENFIFVALAFLFGAFFSQACRVLLSCSKKEFSDKSVVYLYVLAIILCSHCAYIIYVAGFLNQPLSESAEMFMYLIFFSMCTYFAIGFKRAFERKKTNVNVL